MTEKITTKNRARLNWDILIACDTYGRKDFIERFEQDTAFYFHQQLTWEEKERKRELKQLDIPIDRVRPIIRRIVSKIVKNKPTIVALTEDYDSTDLSRRVNAQIQYCMRISKGLSQIRRCLMNSVRGGLGFLHVITDNKSETGQKEVKIEYKTPKIIFVDYKATDPLFDDARQIQILEKVMVSDAIQTYPDKALQKKIIESAGTSYQDEIIVDDRNDTGGVLVGSALETALDSFDELENFTSSATWVELLTTYRKKVKPVYSTSVVSDSGSVITYNLTKEEARDVKKKGFNIEITYKPYIHKEVCTIDDILFEEDLDFISEYPITPMVWEDTENPYPIGETYFIRGHQKLQNKYYEVILSNAQTVSFPNVYFETGAFVNTDEALRNMSRPAGAIELTAGALTGNKVEKTYAQPLNQAFFQLYEQLKHEQEVQSSAFSIQSGDPTNIPETNKALVNLDSFSDRPLAINVDAIEACLERVFKNVIKFQSVVYTDEKLLLIDTDSKNNVRINQPTVEADETGNTIVTDVKNDITKIDYDLSLVAGSMSPLDRTTEFQYAIEAVKLGATPEFALKKMPVEGIDEEVRKMDTVKRLSDQNQQLTFALEQIQKELENAYAQAEKSEKGKISAEYKNKYDVGFANIQMIMKNLNAQLRRAERANEVINKKIVALTGQTHKENPGNKKE